MRVLSAERAGGAARRGDICADEGGVLHVLVVGVGAILSNLVKVIVSDLLVELASPRDDGWVLAELPGNLVEHHDGDGVLCAANDCDGVAEDERALDGGDGQGAQRVNGAVAFEVDVEDAILDGGRGAVDDGVDKKAGPGVSYGGKRLWRVLFAGLRDKGHEPAHGRRHGGFVDLVYEVGDLDAHGGDAEGTLDDLFVGEGVDGRGEGSEDALRVRGEVVEVVLGAPAGVCIEVGPQGCKEAVEVVEGERDLAHDGERDSVKLCGGVVCLAEEAP